MGAIDRRSSDQRSRPRSTRKRAVRPQRGSWRLRNEQANLVGGATTPTTPVPIGQGFLKGLKDSTVNIRKRSDLIGSDRLGPQRQTVAFVLS